MEDRSMLVRPDQIVRVEWVSIEQCRFGPGPIAPAAVERTYRRLLQQGQCSTWPCLVGHRRDGVMQIDDGRHELMASICLQRREVLVAVLEDRKNSCAEEQPGRSLGS